VKVRNSEYFSFRMALELKSSLFLISDFQILIFYSSPFRSTHQSEQFGNICLFNSKIQMKSKSLASPSSKPRLNKTGIDFSNWIMICFVRSSFFIFYDFVLSKNKMKTIFVWALPHFQQLYWCTINLLYWWFEWQLKLYLLWPLTDHN